jgi:uncharacterized protein with HEPN domain
MNEEIRKFLFDIHVSISSIESYLGDNREFTVYKSNKMLRRAVEREFEIIGEALNCVARIDPASSLLLLPRTRDRSFGSPQ